MAEEELEVMRPDRLVDQAGKAGNGEDREIQRPRRGEFQAGNARSVLFSITPEGLALRDAVRPTRREFNQSLLDQLSEEEGRALDSAIDKLTNYLHANNDLV